MAERTLVKTPHDSAVLEVYEWTLSGGDATGVAVPVMRAGDRCVEFDGSDGNVVWEGAGPNSPEVFKGLRDINKVAVNLTASNRIEQLLESPYQVRPRLTSGTGGIVRLTVRGH